MYRNRVETPAVPENSTFSPLFYSCPQKHPLFEGTYKKSQSAVPLVTSQRADYHNWVFFGDTVISQGAVVGSSPTEQSHTGLLQCIMVGKQLRICVMWDL